MSPPLPKQRSPTSPSMVFLQNTCQSQVATGASSTGLQYKGARRSAATPLTPAGRVRGPVPARGLASLLGVGFHRLVVRVGPGLLGGLGQRQADGDVGRRDR